MSHTPGPWNHVVKMDGFTAVGADTLIARVFSRAFEDVENERANAQLIAAAPDLLRALKAVVGEMRREHDAGDGHFSTREVEDAESAIAKAEGQ